MTTRRTGPVAVIVDGYSTGNFLPAAFARLGVRVVHVQSTPELMPTMLLPNLESYVDNLVCRDVDDMVATLRDYAPVAVLAGQEPGVPLADLLSERLGLASNGSALSAARRDKYRMIETVRAAGLHCAAQFKSAEPAAIVDWAVRHGRYPVVVKPLSSASTDNVYICRDAGEVAAAAARVLAARDIFDLANTEALVQSYLSGTEYIVDTVSVAGRRYVCGVWQYEKTMLPTGRNIYDKDVLQDPSAFPVPDLIGYVDGVLAALNIAHGPAHAEVMMTPDGPALVEIGARLNGNMNPGFHDVCLGANQADLIALAYARPAEFTQRYAGRIYTRRQDAIVHNTATTLDGEIAGVDQAVVDTISALPTVHLLNVKLAPGRRMRPTADLLGSPLRIFMTGGRAAMHADYAAIQGLKDRVYRLR
ncbi:ATP-grasp domain-containing protein [Actinophytocola sp.]|uniref:ATP-grasp domain-containing protein n=1 Tax=Actinophytocola sp. TaxID=1872138 RepID=UPI002D8021A0|nr:ATP-grasp domain-containing protein [Actinophytocola sp.]HET9138977.1 ATP-grasp domain-containing protein [Actinophytocola sp.]